MRKLWVHKDTGKFPLDFSVREKHTVGAEEHEGPCISCSYNGANCPIWRKWSVSLMQSRPKMDDTSPLPPTLQKWSPNILDTNAAIFHIWNHSLHSSDPEMEPQYQGPAHTWARPILSQPQLSIMKFNLIFISSNNKLKPNLWETWTTEWDKNDLKWQKPSLRKMYLTF